MNDCEFIDAKGESWRVRFAMPDLKDGLKAAGITAEQLSDMKNIPLGNLLEMLWYGCRTLAHARRINYDVFWRDRLSTKMIDQVLNAVMSAIIEAFPQAEEPKEGEDSEVPLSPGPSETSSG